MLSVACSQDTEALFCPMLRRWRKEAARSNGHSPNDVASPLLERRDICFSLLVPLLLEDFSLQIQVLGGPSGPLRNLLKPYVLSLRVIRSRRRREPALETRTVPHVRLTIDFLLSSLLLGLS